VSTKEETLKEFKKHLSKLNEIDAIHPTQYYLANRSMRLASGEKKLMLKKRMELFSSFRVFLLMDKWIKAFEYRSRPFPCHFEHDKLETRSISTSRTRHQTPEEKQR